jgi:hypothetical protein
MDGPLTVTLAFFATYCLTPEMPKLSRQQGLQTNVPPDVNAVVHLGRNAKKIGHVRA